MHNQFTQLDIRKVAGGAGQLKPFTVFLFKSTFHPLHSKDADFPIGCLPVIIAAMADEYNALVFIILKNIYPLYQINWLLLTIVQRRLRFTATEKEKDPVSAAIRIGDDDV